MIAPITGENRHIVSRKYPQQLHWDYSQAASFLMDLKPNQVQWPVRELPGDIINSIRSQNKGKANGLFMDSLDAFICLVKHEDADANRVIRLLFKQLFNGQIDECMRLYLTNTYLFCLYKNETDPTKLRPIGVPTAIWWITTNHIARTFHQKFARHSFP